MRKQSTYGGKISRKAIKKDHDNKDYKKIMLFEQRAIILFFDIILKGQCEKNKNDQQVDKHVKN